jgi:hypothetical protein
MKRFLQAGLVGVLFQQFRTPIFVSILYLGLSIAFHVWSLHVRWREPTSYWWTDGLQALYVIQRFGKKSQEFIFVLVLFQAFFTFV